LSTLQRFPKRTTIGTRPSQKITQMKTGAMLSPASGLPTSAASQTTTSRPTEIPPKRIRQPGQRRKRCHGSDSGLPASRLASLGSRQRIPSATKDRIRVREAA
jgi:hypothetical protein